jgi:hypothetical protein
MAVGQIIDGLRITTTMAVTPIHLKLAERIKLKRYRELRNNTRLKAKLLRARMLDRNRQ